MSNSPQMPDPDTPRRTSEHGVAFLELHEGVVLKAYRDPIGIWTIGAGLTKASGVVTPRAGMRLSKQDASRLLTLALQRNYEPRVAKAMPDARQYEFDAGVSFDWNTGAIHRASWVRAWLNGHSEQARLRLGLWKKAGGRVLPGLVRRRAEEADLLLHGIYHGVAKTEPAKRRGQARVALPLSVTDMADIRAMFVTLGYDPGDDETGIAEAALRQFQRDSDLTVDGIFGRASLSALKRHVDARSAPAGPAATVVGGAGTTMVVPDQAAEGVAGVSVDALGWIIILIGALWLAWKAYQYRDAIATEVQGLAPRLAKFLRSF
ncbi:glycoside hydrolase family protein [uncultured Tateyamaria sp.]|uniref:glycoside hydrolase family protein n=1 Tax=uncultured Tateyamaria sp. TaxID=455651 RepID=UPI002625110E|nr:glycoside hydrolase family protein [uncultured Tateyamaria sp.]